MSDHTQFICTSQPHCECAGPNGWDQCSCVASRLVSVSPAGDTTACLTCGAPMVLIDFATGEPVGPRAA